MYFGYNSAIWRPTKAIMIVLIMVGLLQPSIGSLGSADSTIYYVGSLKYGGYYDNSEEGFLDADVPALRSVVCGGASAMFLYENNTLISKGALAGAYNLYDDVSSVASSNSTLLYSLASNGSLYEYNSFLGHKRFELSPPRMNEDIRIDSGTAIMAFNHFPPGSITNEPVIHEPNVPLYKFIGAWGNLEGGHIGMELPTLPYSNTSAMFYEGPDLIVKKLSTARQYSVFILHNDTVVVSSRYGLPPTAGPEYMYRPILYNDSIDPSSVKIVDVSASIGHVLLLSEDHRLFFFGYNRYFVSGITGLQEMFFVQRVSEVPLDGIFHTDDDYIVQARALFAKSSAITKRGFVYIWGTWQTYTNLIHYRPTLEDSLLQYRFAVTYLNVDDITKTSNDASGACILTRPSGCTGPPPTAEYYCIDHLWTKGDGEFFAETLTVSYPLEVDGNVTITGSLVINTPSNISVTQCLSIGSIEVVKQQGDDSPSPDIISTGKHCPDISNTTISVISTGDVKECEKRSVTLSTSEFGGRIIYSALFKSNDTDCIHHHHYWWIILVSVLGGVVLIVIITILMISFVKPIRDTVRPFWMRKFR